MDTIVLDKTWRPFGKYIRLRVSKDFWEVNLKAPQKVLKGNEATQTHLLRIGRTVYSTETHQISSYGLTLLWLNVEVSSFERVPKT